MDVLSRLEAMIEMSRAATSLVLNFEPRTSWRRSKKSLTRLRMRRTSSSRKTISVRLKRAKTRRFEARGIWGERMPTSYTVPTVATSRTSIPPMIRRFRLRRSWFPVSGTTEPPAASLRSRHGEQRGADPGRLLRFARHARQDRVHAAERDIGPHPDVVELPGVQA